MLTDPIADMLTRIRNANKACKDHVDMPFSKIKEQILKIFKKEGFIKDCQFLADVPHKGLRVFLRYSPTKEKVISGLRRVSRPGLRKNVGKDEIPRIIGGMGVVVLSTSKGIMTGKQAKQTGVGGEIICYIW